VLDTFKGLLGDEDVEDPLGPSPRAEVDISNVLAAVKRVHNLG